MGPQKNRREKKVDKIRHYNCIYGERRRIEKDAKKGLNALRTINARTEQNPKKKHNVRSILRNETRYPSHPIHEKISSRIFGHFYSRPFGAFSRCCCACVKLRWKTKSICIFRYCLAAVAEQVRKRQSRWHSRGKYLFSWLLFDETSFFFTNANAENSLAQHLRACASVVRMYIVSILKRF